MSRSGPSRRAASEYVGEHAFTERLDALVCVVVISQVSQIGEKPIDGAQDADEPGAPVLPKRAEERMRSVELH